jgi:hypothetical protein
MPRVPRFLTNNVLVISTPILVFLFTGSTSHLTTSFVASDGPPHVPSRVGGDGHPHMEQQTCSVQPCATHEQLQCRGVVTDGIYMPMSGPHTLAPVHLPDATPKTVRSLDPHRPEALSDSSPNPHAPLSNSFVPRVKAVS